MKRGLDATHGKDPSDAESCVESTVARAAGASRWSVVTEVLARLVAPVSSMLLARILSPEAFGAVATVNMVVAFADIFSDAGFQKYIVQHEFAGRRELDDSTCVAFWTNLAVSTVAWGLIFCFRDGIATLVGSAGLGSAVAVAAMALPLTSFASIQSARFKREFDFKALFKVRMAAAAVPLAVTVPLALLLRSYWALIAGTLVGSLVNAVLLTALSPWRPRLFYSWALLRDMFSYSWWILLESVTNWLSSNADIFIVGLFLSSYWLGVYKTSMTTVGGVMALVTAAVSSPMFSALSRLSSDRSALLEVFGRYMRAVSVFVVPLGFSIWVFRDAVTGVLLGSQWGDAAGFVGLWGLSSAFVLVFGTFYNGLYNAAGKTRLSFLCSVLCLFVMLPTVYFTAGISYDTLYAWRTVARFSMVPIQLIIAWGAFGLTPVTQLRNAAPAFFCVVPGCLACLLLGGYFEGWVFFAVGAPVFCGCYLICLHLFYPGMVFGSAALFGFDPSCVVDRLCRIANRHGHGGGRDSDE